MLLAKRRMCSAGSHDFCISHENISFMYCMGLFVPLMDMKAGMVMCSNMNGSWHAGQTLPVAGCATGVADP